MELEALSMHIHSEYAAVFAHRNSVDKELFMHRCAHAHPCLVMKEQASRAA